MVAVFEGKNYRLFCLQMFGGFNVNMSAPYLWWGFFIAFVWVFTRHSCIFLLLLLFFFWNIPQFSFLCKFIQRLFFSDHSSCNFSAQLPFIHAFFLLETSHVFFLKSFWHWRLTFDTCAHFSWRFFLLNYLDTNLLSISFTLFSATTLLLFMEILWGEVPSIFSFWLVHGSFRDVMIKFFIAGDAIPNFWMYLP